MKWHKLAKNEVNECVEWIELHELVGQTRKDGANIVDEIKNEWATNSGLNEWPENKFN